MKRYLGSRSDKAIDYTERMYDTYEATIYNVGSMLAWRTILYCNLLRLEIICQRSWYFIIQPLVERLSIECGEVFDDEFKSTCRFCVWASGHGWYYRSCCSCDERRHIDVLYVVCVCVLVNVHDGRHVTWNLDRGFDTSVSPFTLHSIITHNSWLITHNFITLNSL